ncbi:MAG: hypothetical protein D4R84_17180 [Rhodocyclaceae bacterium]|nr:MAG: hypothetical protein D4R84_17180 [Rhodocyclaceae bacterium]
MPTIKNPATVAKLIPAAAESSTVTRANRARLSKVLAAKSGAKQAGSATPEIPTKSNGGKQKKLKLVSNRCKMPDAEYAQLAALKKRLSLLGVGIRKSELLRAGLMLLVDMDDERLKKAVARVEPAKACHPATKAN